MEFAWSVHRDVLVLTYNVLHPTSNCRSVRGPQITYADFTLIYIDIYRAANLLIHDHGEHATIEAAQRTDALFEAGDLDGKAMWLRVSGAVREV